MCRLPILSRVSRAIPLCRHMICQPSLPLSALLALLALCHVKVPGLPGNCELLLMKSQQTSRMKQLPMYLYQLGGEPDVP